MFQQRRTAYQYYASAGVDVQRPSLKLGLDDHSAFGSYLLGALAACPSSGCLRYLYRMLMCPAITVKVVPTQKCELTPS